MMQHIHLVGGEGSGMSGLAEILCSSNFHVSLCDQKLGEQAQRLHQKGVVTFAGHDVTHLDGVDTLVISQAIDEGNTEVKEARNRGISVYRYPEMLAHVMRTKATLAVAGSHGKTTTTGMLAFVLREAGYAPSFVVGGQVPQLQGSACLGHGDHFVVEACEYKRSFMNFQPHMAIITNIEPDHLDYYRDFSDLSAAFSAFVCKIPANGVLLCGTQARAALPANLVCLAETYSITGAADWEAINICKKTGNGYSFTVRYQGKSVGEFSTCLPGVHNVENALAVIGLSHHLQVPYASLRKAVADFQGVGRRFEILLPEPITIISDYAHHPTQLQAVGKMARASFGNARLWAIFQPHQANRTYHLFQEFVKSFADFDEIIISDIYYARDSVEDKNRVHSADLADAIQAQGKSARHIAQFPQIVEFLTSRWQKGDVVLALGAGSIHELAKLLCGCASTMVVGSEQYQCIKP